MIRILILLLPVILGMGTAQAICTWKSGEKTTQTVPPQLIEIAADAPVDSSTPIARFDTPMLGYEIIYNYCVVGSEYGRRVINLESYSSADKTFKTNIPGIVMKPLWTNGAGTYSGFPSTGYMPPEGEAEFIDFLFPVTTSYRVEFYKVADNLQLTDPTGDEVMPAGDIGYFYLLVGDDPSNYLTRLALSQIKIISTPSCTADSAKTVDFGKVTSATLASGITQPLDFKINCKSDYGSFAATASMTTETPSSDSSAILVTDAEGNTDRMIIKIQDSKGQQIKVDGSNGETISKTASSSNAEFNWKAELLPAGSQKPAAGGFSARAEIVFDIK